MIAMAALAREMAVVVITVRGNGESKGSQADDIAS